MSIKWKKGPPPNETGRWLAWYPGINGPAVVYRLVPGQPLRRASGATADPPYYAEITPPEEESPAPPLGKVRRATKAETI